jgi:acetyl-CoA carboxylase biotin carboxylase subunit
VIPPVTRIRRVLVANRGEIALRIIRAAHALGIETVLAASEADRDALPSRVATRTVCIGPAPSAQSYLKIDALIAAAVGTGCDALHPGYGFLSESEHLAAACADANVVFVGPTPDQILRMGNKLEARALAKAAGVPMLPGSQKVADAAAAAEVADAVGYPMMLKAAAGGGGRGMKIVTRREDMERLFAQASGEARNAFGDDTLYLERYVSNARHVEVQVLGDAHGNVIHLGERDCSLQRRHQKLIEESPAPLLPVALRDGIRDAAIALARNIGYRNAGTVEFIVDADRDAFYFLEMNTRIQVEHPVSELVSGIDLVQEQFRVAAGEPLRWKQDDVVLRGHAIECRINAEVPHLGFRPSPGRITRWSPPEGPNIRLDSHCHAGYVVPIHYDSMIGKLIVYGADRDEALLRMRAALAEFRIDGIGTTLPFLQHAVAHADFAAGRVNTALVERMIAEMNVSPGVA